VNSINLEISSSDSRLILFSRRISSEMNAIAISQIKSGLKIKPALLSIMVLIRYKSASIIERYSISSTIIARHIRWYIPIHLFLKDMSLMKNFANITPGKVAKARSSADE
jgi:hypothetical protein